MKAPVRLLYLIVFVCLSFCGIAQNVVPCLDTAFRKNYLPPLNSFVQNQMVLANGDILLNEIYKKTTDTFKHTIISRLKKNGDIIWSKTIDQSAINAGVEIQQITEDGAGKIVMAGFYTEKAVSKKFIDKYIFVGKLEGNGDLFWQKIYRSNLLYQETISDDDDGNEFPKIDSSKTSLADIQALLIDDETSNIYFSMHTSYFNISFNQEFIYNPTYTINESGKFIWAKDAGYAEAFINGPIVFCNNNSLQIIGNNIFCMSEGYEAGDINLPTFVNTVYNKKTGTMQNALLFNRFIDTLALINKNDVLKFSTTKSLPHASIKTADNKIFYFGNASENTNQAGYAIMMNSDGVFEKGTNFITPKNAKGNIEVDAKYYVANNKNIVQIKKAASPTDKNFYLNTYNNNQQILQRQKINVNNPLITKTDIGNLILSADADNQYFNAFINYNTTSNKNIFELNKIFIGQQGPVNCFGDQGLADVATEMNVRQIKGFFSGTSTYGLEDTMANIFVNENIFTNNTLCILPSRCSDVNLDGQQKICNSLDSITFTATKNGGCFKVAYFDIDPAVVNSMTYINDTTVKIRFKKDFKGNIYTNLGTCGIIDSLPIEVKLTGAFTLGADTVLCNGNTLTLQAPTNFETYLWNDGSTNTFLSVTKPGKYFVSATNLCGQLFTDTINILQQTNNLFAGPDTSKCNADTLQLSASIGFTNYSWEPTSHISPTNQRVINAYPTATTAFKVTAISTQGCTVTDDVIVTYKASPKVNLGNDTTICEGEIINLNANNNYSSYLWNTTAQTPTIAVKEKGLYFVKTIFNNGCTSSDSVQINVADTANNFLNKTAQFCTTDKVVLKTNGQAFNAYLWSNGATTPTISINNAGTYYLQVTNVANCKATLPITVTEKDCRQLVFFPKAFSPNNDGKNDGFKPLVFGELNKYSITIFNRYGLCLFTTNNIQKSWDGFYKGSQQPSGAYVWQCTYSFEGRKAVSEKGMVMLVR